MVSRFSRCTVHHVIFMRRILVRSQADLYLIAIGDLVDIIL